MTPHRCLAATLLAACLLAAGLLAASPAHADVGVETTSRSAGAPGDAVTVTIGCGFCYPPCEGPPGYSKPLPCMPGNEAPPASFPVSLVPIGQAPKLHRCGPNALCAPKASKPPSRSPYSLLGEATPPVDRSSGGKPFPRYLLQFDIPDLRPGVYTFVIFCGTCQRGEAGSLIAYPTERHWRLRIHPSDPCATIGTLVSPSWPTSQSSP